MPSSTDLDPRRPAEASVPRLAFPSGIARAPPGRLGLRVVQELVRDRIPFTRESALIHNSGPTSSSLTLVHTYKRWIADQFPGKPEEWLFKVVI